MKFFLTTLFLIPLFIYSQFWISGVSTSPNPVNDCDNLVVTVDGNLSSSNCTYQLEATDSGNVNFSIDTCPVTVTAVNSDDGNSYEYYSNLDGASFSINFDDIDFDDFNYDDFIEKKELLNSNNEQIGYLYFNLLSGEYYLVDNDGNKFSDS